MKIFLAGGNGKNKIIRQVHGEGISCGDAFEKLDTIPDTGGGYSVDENLPCQPSHTAEIPGRTTFHDFCDRGGILSNLDEDISGRQHNIPRLYRSDIIRGGFDQTIKNHRPYILESFYYADEDTERLMPYFGDFMLDSGAFTFMGGFSFTENKDKKTDFEEYLERYADFVNRNNVEKFFELDIDSVVGYEAVKEYRRKLERLTGRQPIPVWHSNRGKDEYIRSCEEYPYVALGGIVGGEWKPQAEKHIPWFIRTAHKHGAKIHGLGYTKLAKLKEYHFDSVDSTAWTTGNRFGYICKFDGRTIQKIQCPNGKRLGDPRRVALINYTEWIKYQRWADTHL